MYPSGFENRDSVTRNDSECGVVACGIGVELAARDREQSDQAPMTRVSTKLTAMQSLIIMLAHSA